MSNRVYKQRIPLQASQEVTENQDDIYNHCSQPDFERNDIEFNLPYSKKQKTFGSYKPAQEQRLLSCRRVLSTVEPQTALAAASAAAAASTAAALLTVDDPSTASFAPPPSFSSSSSSPEEQENAQITTVLTHMAPGTPLSIKRQAYLKSVRADYIKNSDGCSVCKSKDIGRLKLYSKRKITLTKTTLTGKEIEYLVSSTTFQRYWNYLPYKVDGFSELKRIYIKFINDNEVIKCDKCQSKYCGTKLNNFVLKDEDGKEYSHSD